MKKEVFCFVLFFAFGCQAAYLGSDLELLNQNSDVQKDPVDPYWNLAWHGKVASYGDPDSQFFVAQVYEQGQLVPLNKQKAIEFYQKAASQGHLESCHRLADLIPDEKEKWYLQAARLNDPQAQLKLFRFYEEKGQISDSILWLEKALLQLFPGVDDLTQVSPDLKRLKDMQ